MLSPQFLRAAAAALVQADYSPEAAQQIINDANAGNHEALATIYSAMQTSGSREDDKKDVPYTVYERFRVLEEALADTGIQPDHLFLLAIAYMMKNQPKMLERLATVYMNNTAKMITALSQASTGNMITAYGSNFLMAMILEHNYMIRQQGADNFIVSLNWLVGSQALANILQQFAVPEMLTFAVTGAPISAGKASIATKEIVKV